MQHIAFIGLGNMGAPMARNLVAAGFHVSVFDLAPAAVAHLRTATWADGFGYAGYPDTPEYGISIAQPGWVSELIARETGLQVLEYRAAAWDQHQDVVICTRRTQRHTKRLP